MPDCSVLVSECEDIGIVNQLDGFNVQPRFSVPFDGMIDVRTASSRSIFLLGLPESGEHRIIGINQIVWEPPTFTLHFQSDEVLYQHTRYALIVTNSVRDTVGAPIQESESFAEMRRKGRGSYSREIRRALATARHLGFGEEHIVVAAVFTTQSVTAALEQIRDRQSSLPSASFQLLPGGGRAVFPVSQLAGYAFNQQTSADPPAFTPLPNNINGICDSCGANLLSLLQLTPGAVGTLAFGKYESPDYEVHPGEYIPDLPTASRRWTPTGLNEIYFNLFIPAGRKPPAGWPVAIFGHGSGTNKNVQPFAVAGALAQHGIATISINIAGNGLGPGGTLTLTRVDGTTATIPAGGRGIDQNGDHRITEGEGRSAAAPRVILGSRDGQRQTVIDLMQLVRTIQGGIDVDGDGSRDIDPTRIYYFGHSLGGHYGALFMAVEPLVRAGVLNAPGTPTSDLRLTPMFRSAIGTMLASRVPPLLNAPGRKDIGGVAVGPPQFEENLPARDSTPLIDDVNGSRAIQDFLDVLAWVGQYSSAAAWARHIIESPLPGVPPKSIIIQVGKGDQLSPNPVTNAIVRAGRIESRLVLYRNDVAYAENPAMPKNPHFTLTGISFPVISQIAKGLLEQIAVFFESDGTRITCPEPQRFFETPAMLPLSEDLAYIP
jgi:hypothetical protein